MEQFTKRNSMHFLMNSFTVMFAYFGFIQGDATAATLAGIIMVFGFIVMALAVFLVRQLPFAHHRAIENGDEKAQKIFLATGARLTMVTKRLNIWREFLWDIPVAAMAFFGGAWVVGALWVLHIAGYVYMKQHIMHHLKENA